MLLPTEAREVVRFSEVVATDSCVLPGVEAWNRAWVSIRGMYALNH